jgi:hypothetical protein
MKAPLGSKYSLYATDGNSYNPEWNNSLINMLTAFIADSEQSAEDRECAATALKFYADTVAAEGDQPTETNLHVAQMFGKQGAKMLWETPEDCLLSTKTWPDGITRTHVLSKRYHGPRSVEEPTPTSVPTFTPAVPLPVMPVSDVEKAAVKESDLTFDERYSPGAVAARVAAIEKEAAQIRASREQTE